MEKVNPETMEPIGIGFARPGEGRFLVRLSGHWRIGGEFPPVEKVQEEIESGGRPVQVIGFETKGLTGWDSGLLNFLFKVKDLCTRLKVRFDGRGLPAGVQRLMALASAVPEKKDARRTAGETSFLAQVGGEVFDFLKTAGEMLAFIGEASVSFVKFLFGRARYRRSDLVLLIQQCGAQALPIVSLISLLVGLILAFIGAMQLKLFGAEIYVANLVGIAMVRVMGAVMTGIIMAGRTGAAFAAQIGTMEANEEIDAMKTMGISPMEFLVLPRMLALALMMPLLCLYADLMGLLGGAIVGVGLMDISVVQYYNQTRGAMGPLNLWIGLFHSFIFGILVALAGCLRGMQCGRSASAVGDAATSAVVTGIVSIILATATLTIIFNVMGV
jgi:phospholipid/cholesterol/gamma-HCH transport system permease protein